MTAAVAEGDSGAAAAEVVASAVCGGDASLSMGTPIKGVTEENPNETYKSLALISRALISLKALIVPEARKQAKASMANLLDTD